MSEFEKYIDEYFEAKTNIEEEKVLIKALEIAEKNKNMENIIRCHLKLCMTEVFLGHDVESMNHLFWSFENMTEEIINESDIYYDLMWNSKYITALVTLLFYDKDAIKEIFEWIKGLYEANNEELKPIYGILIHYHYYGLDLGYDMEDIFNKWKKEDNEFFDDCDACLKDSEINYYLKEKNYEKAFSLAEDFDKEKISCEEVPALTYSNLLYPLVKESKFAKADKYYKEAYKLCKNDLNLISGIIKIIEYLSIVDVEKAFEIYVENINLFDQIETEYGLLELCFADYILFTGLSKKSAQVIIPFNKKTEYYNTNELASNFRNKYQEIVEKFDERNDNNYLSTYFKEKEDFYLNTFNVWRN